MPVLHLLRRLVGRLAGTAAVAVPPAAGLAVVGDFGLTQHWLSGVEQRSLAGRNARADRWGLRVALPACWPAVAQH